MHVTYDPQVDIMTLRLKPGQIAESDEICPGIIFDYDAKGNVVRMEILEASSRVSHPNTIQLDVGGAFTQAVPL